jgi:hypothetical protein
MMLLLLAPFALLLGTVRVVILTGSISPRRRTVKVQQRDS